MERPKGFNSKVFLFRMLAFVFFVQFFSIVVSVIKCDEYAKSYQKIPVEVCPNIGDRFEETTGTMIATVLSLLVPTGVSDP